MPARPFLLPAAHSRPTLARTLALAVAALVSLASGCADGTADTSCHFDSDCANGASGGTCVDGACVADPCPACLDASPITGDPDDGVPGPTCTLDGKVERNEITLGAGVGIPFRNSGIEDMLTVDLAGAADATGLLRWDLTRAAGAVTTDLFTVLWPTSAAPSSAAFPDADYLVALPGSPGLIAFFDLNDTALRLLGTADASGAFTQLVYDPPVDLLRFPLRVGDAWETRTTARGTLLGAEVQVTDHYTTEVRAGGQVKLPAGDLPALQLVTIQERSFDTAGFTQVTTTVDFLAECGGFVAKAVSAEGERGLPEQVRLLSVMLPLTCEADVTCGSGGVCTDGRCALGGVFGDYAPLEPVCRPNGDGVIDDAELPVRAGLSGVFRLSAPGMPVAVDLTGEPEPGSALRTWRFDADTLGQDERLEAAMEPAGFWFAPYFSDATYVAVLDAGSGTNAVFRRTPGELSILGLASNQPDRTLLVFDTPVPAMRFPLKEGDAWTADTRTTGKLEGQDVSIDMHYALHVDAAGHVRLPAGTVPVLRLRLDTRQQVVGAPFALARSTVLFVAECLGAVARIVSSVNEPEAEFTQAAEVSRMTVPRCLSSLQCPGDAHCEDGRCVGGAPPPPEADMGVGPAPDGGLTPDAGPNPDPDAGAPLCNPVGDFVVDRAEFPLGAGQQAHFRIADSSAGLAVDLAGADCPAGKCWDFSGARDGDGDVVVELMSVEDRWFAADFPGATYVSYVDREQGWLGVFRLTDNALQLLGTASAEDGAMKTTYDPPVDLYRFPLHVGDHWTISTTQSGFTNSGFVPIYTNDTYTITVAASGDVNTPQGPFRAVQVIAQVSQAVPFTFIGNDRIVHTFVSECFGIIARAVSEADETEPYFARASRLERLAPAR